MRFLDDAILLAFLIAIAIPIWRMAMVVEKFLDKVAAQMERITRATESMSENGAVAMRSFEQTAREGRSALRHGERAMDRGMFGLFIGSLKEFLVPHPQRRAVDRKAVR